MKYQDSEGREKTLRQMLEVEPGWAMSRIRSAEKHERMWRKLRLQFGHRLTPSKYDINLINVDMLMSKIEMDTENEIIKDEERGLGLRTTNDYQATGSSEPSGPNSEVK